MTTVHLCEANGPKLAYVLKLLEAAPGLEVSTGRAEIPLLLADLTNSAAQVLVLALDPRPNSTLQLVEQVMHSAALPILLLSSAAADSVEVAGCLDAGAVAVLGLGYSAASESSDRLAFLRQLRILSGIRVIGRPNRAIARADASASEPRLAGPPALIAIGASTGGPQALERLLGGLPPRFASPVAVVQHITVGFSTNLLAWLKTTSALEVLEVRQRLMPKPGWVYFAPEREHLIVAKDGSLCPLAAPARNGHLPSVDVLFESVAEVHGERGCGVLLTGMGRDGADGLLAIRRRGGATAAQDEASCTVFGMPQAAIALSAAQRVADPAAIGRWLVTLDPGSRHV